MSYLGNTPTTQSFISGTDYFNGTGSQTAFTLSRTVASVNDIQAVVNNVVQVPNDAYTISGTTITFTSAPSAGTQNVYVRYLSTTTQAITPSQNTVSWNTLDSNTQQDLGISFKNRIINGGMVINQRALGSVNPDNGAVTVDRWQVGVDITGKITVNQSSIAPTGFTNSFIVTSSSAYTPSSNEAFNIRQNIEGFNTADLAWGTASAKTVTLSFWVRSSLTGTFGGSFVNSAYDRSYPFSYTISSANTWEYKTATVAGDTSGTWVGATNGVGLRILFGLGAGSSKSGTAGAWASGFYNQPTGTVSVVGTNGATFYITGVQLEVGTQATTFTLAGGSYGAELALCQRYYEKLDVGVDETLVLQAISTSAARGPWIYKVSKRATPTNGSSGTIRLSNATAGTATNATIGFNTGSVDVASISATGSGSLVAGNATTMTSVSGVLTASAEL